MKQIRNNNKDKSNTTKRITTQQLNFLENILKGETQYQAYLNAYPSSKSWKRDSVDQAAYQLFRLEHIQMKFKEMQKRIEDKIVKKSVWTTEMAIEKLTNLAKQAETEIQESNKINMTRVQAILGAVKELNSMHGYNEKNITATNKVVIVGSEEDLED